MPAESANTTPLPENATARCPIINLGVERQKRSDRDRTPVQSTEMALVLSMMALLSPKKGRRLRDDLARWSSARPDDASVLAAHKAALALWG